MNILKVILAFLFFIGMIISAAAVRLWAITLVVLSILKLTSILMIPWFAGLFTLSAIGTPLFMLILGLFSVFANFLGLAVSADKLK